MNCQTQSKVATDRSMALDACRGVAVLAVIVFHLRTFEIIPIPPDPFAVWPMCGMFGVDLFYVLSGFFITQSVLRPATWNPGDFLKARVTRIYPAYLLSLLVALFGKIWSGELATDSYLVANVLLHVSMLHNLLPGVTSSINGVYWTLGVEFPYYLLMLALAPFLRESRKFWNVSYALLTLSVVWRASVFLFIPAAERFFPATQLPGALDAFALGGIAAMLDLSATSSQRIKQYRWPLFIAGVTCTVLCLRYFAYHFNDFWSDGRSVILWRSGLEVSLALVVIGCARMAGGKALSWSGLPWLGKISFSLYLYHYLAILLTNALAAGQAWQAKLVMTTAITLLVSWASWRFVEMRFHRSNSVVARSLGG
jgi:peptidoglycan/LPS O-acetylase OafA/YrhL